MSNVTRCPHCDADLTKGTSVDVTYSVVLSTACDEHGTLVLHEVVDVAENAEDAVPTAARCRACGKSVRSKMDTEGTDWDQGME